eukprot:5351026-Pyramimonas_sp.AAC.1
MKSSVTFRTPKPTAVLEDTLHPRILLIFWQLESDPPSASYCAKSNPTASKKFCRLCSTQGL